MAPTWTATLEGRPPSFAKKAGKNAAKLSSSKWVEALRQRMHQAASVRTAGPVKVRIRLFLNPTLNAANPPDLDNLAKTILDVLSKSAHGMHCVLPEDREVEVLHVSREQTSGAEKTEIKLSWA